MIWVTRNRELTGAQVEVMEGVKRQAVEKEGLGLMGPMIEERSYFEYPGPVIGHDGLCWWFSTITEEYEEFEIAQDGTLSQSD